MKNSIIILFLVCSAVTFAQQGTNSFFNNRPSDDDLSTPNVSRYSLNLDFFKLEDFKENTKTLSGSLRKSYNQKAAPTSQLPIYKVDGTFFLEILEADKTYDHKLKIINFEKER